MFWGSLCPCGIGVSLKLVFTGPGVKEDPEEAADRAEENAKKDEPSVRGDVFCWDAKRGKELPGETGLRVD